jgi:hypothetical protein
MGMHQCRFWEDKVMTEMKGKVNKKEMWKIHNLEYNNTVTCFKMLQ